MGVSFADNQRLDDEAAAAHAIYMEVGNITEACRLWRERRGEDMPWTNLTRPQSKAQGAVFGPPFCVSGAQNKTAAVPVSEISGGSAANYVGLKG